MGLFTPSGAPENIPTCIAAAAERHFVPARRAGRGGKSIWIVRCRPGPCSSDLGAAWESQRPADFTKPTSEMASPPLPRAFGFDQTRS